MEVYLEPYGKKKLPFYIRQVFMNDSNYIIIH